MDFASQSLEVFSLFRRLLFDTESLFSGKIIFICLPSFKCQQCRGVFSRREYIFSLFAFGSVFLVHWVMLVLVLTCTKLTPSGKSQMVQVSLFLFVRSAFGTILYQCLYCVEIMTSWLWIRDAKLKHYKFFRWLNWSGSSLNNSSLAGFGIGFWHSI